MSEKVLMKGNEAVAEGAIRSGCRHFFGYPITPQNELAAYMSKRMPKENGVFLQAESEIAAINMVLGAAATGVRAMTSSSSPGIALKSEGLSYLAGCDLPAVLVNVQRGGPGLGGIQPGQADYFIATQGSGHGDFRMIVLAPGGVQEMFDHAVLAFYLADRYRMTVMILSDGILGQMMEPVTFGNTVSDAPEKPWALGINRKREKNIVSSLFLDPYALEAQNFRRFERYAEVEANEARFEGFMLDDAEIVVVAYGASARVARNSIAEARSQGIKAGMLRPITLWPFPKEACLSAAKTAKAFISVEMSMGQMVKDIELAVRCGCPVLLCNRVGGVVPEPAQVLDCIRKAADL
ncbi:MAG: 3-methyl-2-oxobutanoate dehydrogenase subunit VorB [Oscillospiraceae bacterium]|nr:3-methyl-2-oxobutanoate dehydrogenase subunit VorB [Oscillospiraceae bacterium]